MKRMVILLSMVGAILAGGLAVQHWLSDYTLQLSQQMESLSDSAERGENVLTEVRAVHADWECFQRRLGAVIHEETLNDLESHIKRSEMLAEFPHNEVYRRDLVLELLEAADAAGELYQKECLSLQNIF